jgi:small subunit ribosomal protein S2
MIDKSSKPVQISKEKEVVMPKLQAFLKAGVQFGHETRRWNPKMGKYLFGSKDNIHIIDISQTVELLKKALEFLSGAARKGSILFVGTKRQASQIVKKEAFRSGAYFVTNRWAGGLLTNFKTISKSLRRLNKLEELFETGVEGRTKYEISQMKKEWERLNRIYGGVKAMKRYPTAVVIVDPRYEIGAVNEATLLKIPTIALADSNCNPEDVDYVIPGNDDALGSIRLIMKLLGDATLLGNGGHGVKHKDIDYTKVEVKILKTEVKVDPEAEKKVSTKFRVSKRVAPSASVQKKTAGGVKIRIKRTASKDAKNLQDNVSSTSTKKVKKQIKKEPSKKIITRDKQLSTRTQNALDVAKLSLAKASKMTEEELVGIKGIGASAVKEILG